MKKVKKALTKVRDANMKRQGYTKTGRKSGRNLERGNVVTEAIQKAIDRVFDELYYRIVLNATQDEVQKTSIMVNVSRMMTLKKEIEEELGCL